MILERIAWSRVDNPNRQAVQERASASRSSFANHASHFIYLRFQYSSPFLLY